jgi:hypothetical protein
MWAPGISYKHTRQIFFLGDGGNVLTEPSARDLMTVQDLVFSGCLKNQVSVPKHQGLCDHTDIWDY